MTTCYGLVRTRNGQQEWYETASGDARKRAKALRSLGYHVSVEGMGSQVTKLGLVNMTLVDIRSNGLDLDLIPKPDLVML